MAHTTDTLKTSQIVAVPASGPGALPGHEFRCSACIEVAGYSVAQMARDHGRSHVATMMRKEAQPRRRQRA